ncbi:MAG: hypothetical protein RLZZ350_1922 [Verrucomicrobiota bacterium]|jgi:hypothetical protein
MSAWRYQALQLLPELKKVTESAENPYDLWLEVHMYFEEAYDEGNQDMVKRIYEYLWWTCAQPRNPKAENDLFTAAACCLIEHIPEHPKARKDMKRWWPRSKLLEYKSVFIGWMSEGDFEKLLSELYPTK